MTLGIARVAEHTKGFQKDWFGEGCKSLELDKQVMNGCLSRSSDRAYFLPAKGVEMTIVRQVKHESLILAQSERWRRA